MTASRKPTARRDPYHYEFLSKRSMKSAAMKYTEGWLRNFDEENILLEYIDYSKAFDTANQKKCLFTLEVMGFSGTRNSLFRSYF